MPLSITGQNIDITDSIREYVTTKMDKITHHVEDITNAHIVLNVEKDRHMADGNLQATGATMHASASSDDMYAAIDQMVDKLDRQVVKHKEKNQQHS